VALICTDQFPKIKARVEKQTGWTSEQLEHRVSRYRKLPSIPTREDVEAVATKLLAVRWNAEEEQWNLVGPTSTSRFRQGGRWLCPDLQITPASSRQHN